MTWIWKNECFLILMVGGVNAGKFGGLFDSI